MTDETAAMYCSECEGADWNAGPAVKFCDYHAAIIGRANPTPPVSQEVRAARLKEIDERRDDGYERASKLNVHEAAILMLNDINYLRCLPTAPPAEGELISREAAAAMFTELYNCYTASKCAADDRENFLKLKGMAEAYQSAAERIRSLPAATAVPNGNDGWTTDPPAKQGWYWHTFGDGEPVFPISVLKSGGGNCECFVSMGQLGLQRSVDCEDYGGYWMRMVIPSFPSAPAVPIAKVGEGEASRECPCKGADDDYKYDCTDCFGTGLLPFVHFAADATGRPCCIEPDPTTSRDSSKVTCPHCLNEWQSGRWTNAETIARDGIEAAKSKDD